MGRVSLRYLRSCVAGGKLSVRNGAAGRLVLKGNYSFFFTGGSARLQGAGSKGCPTLDTPNRQRKGKRDAGSYIAGVGVFERRRGEGIAVLKQVIR